MAVLPTMEKKAGNNLKVQSLELPINYKDQIKTWVMIIMWEIEK